MVSDRPGGFAQEDLDRLYHLHFPFTRVLENLSLREMAANLLDAYVGRAAGQRILAGEVKRGEGQTIEAVTRTVRAAREAADSIAKLNERRQAEGNQPLRFGLALHIGEVMFGNIGASSRLDFTVIGPAVNYAARLEKVCAISGESIVLSQAVAALLPANATTPISVHTFKDVDEPQQVYRLRSND